MMRLFPLLFFISTLSASLSQAKWVSTDVIYDGNGNVTELLDEAEDIVAEYEYSPFGETTKAVGPAAADNDIRLSTKQ